MRASTRIKNWVGLGLIVAMLLAGGCGPKATVAGYREILEHYRGGHIDQLVADWGAPKGQHVYADGRKEYLFSREYRQDYSEPIYPSIGFGLGYGGYRHFGVGGAAFYPRTVSTHYSVCETRVITDKRGKILEYYFRGDACQAVPSQNQPVN